MATLALKLTLTPLLIAIASFAQRRWGAALGGLIAGLPLTSAPVSVFLAVDHGSAFAARSAIGMLFGTVAMSAFCAAYVIIARHSAWLLSSVLALAACALATFAASLVPQNLALAAAITCPALLALIAFIGRPAPLRCHPLGGTHQPGWLRQPWPSSGSPLSHSSSDRRGAGCLQRSRCSHASWACSRIVAAGIRQRTASCAASQSAPSEPPRSSWSSDR